MRSTPLGSDERCLTTSRRPRRKAYTGRSSSKARRNTPKYAFVLVKLFRVTPNPNLAEIKIPDATPEIVLKYAQTDEQALLAKVRYNRLIDIFLSITAHSLQSHMRTTVVDVGQIETDEVHVGVDSGGVHYVVPVQAKGGSDELGSVQTEQDLAWAWLKFPDLVARAVGVQFASDDVIAMFKLTETADGIRIASERHYRLVPRDEITPEDLLRYRTTS